MSWPASLHNRHWPPINGGLQLELESRVLSGQFYRNDSPPPGEEYDDGEVELRYADDSVLFGNTQVQSYSVRLIKPEEGMIYPLYYGVETFGDTMPRNGDAPIGCFVYEPLVL